MTDSRYIRTPSNEALRSLAAALEADRQRYREAERPACCSAVCLIAQYRGDSHACPAGVCVNPARSGSGSSGELCGICFGHGREQTLDHPPRVHVCGACGGSGRAA